MALVEVDLPSPTALRPGWAALAATLAARGWGGDVYAEGKDWVFHDGGGNWACVRFVDGDRAVLFGHDHEYSETYFRDAAEYFGEEETDLLAEGPGWWGDDLDTPPCGEWIGFVYGWDGSRWQRANYAKGDGLTSVGLLKGCSIGSLDYLTSMVDADPVDGNALQSLVDADTMITEEMLAAAMPDADLVAGVAAAQAFRAH